MSGETKRADILYNIDDRPPVGKSVIFAFQHILAMFAGNVTVPLLVINIVGLNSEEGTFLIQCALLVAGVATLLQVRGIKAVGSRLPIVMGTSNAFLSTVVAITSQYGIGACLGASFIGGLFEAVLGNFIGRLKKIFNPLVSGIVVMTIGITLIPTGMKQAAGSKTAAGLGAPVNLLLSGLVILVIVLCSRSRNKTLKSASILVGIVVGYVVAAVAGLVDFSAIGQAAAFSVPMPFRYRWEFHWSAIVAMLFMYVATTVETVGDMTALTVVAQNRQPTPEESRGGILADGLGSSLAAVFNAFPNTEYRRGQLDRRVQPQHCEHRGGDSGGHVPVPQALGRDPVRAGAGAGRSDVNHVYDGVYLRRVLNHQRGFEQPQHADHGGFPGNRSGFQPGAGRNQSVRGIGVGVPE